MSAATCPGSGRIAVAGGGTCLHCGRRDVSTTDGGRLRPHRPRPFVQGPYFDERANRWIATVRHGAIIAHFRGSTADDATRVAHQAARDAERGRRSLANVV